MYSTFIWYSFKLPYVDCTVSCIIHESYISLQNLDVYDSALLDEGDVNEACWKQERKRNHSEVDHANMSDEGEGFVDSSALASQSYKKRRISESTSLLPAFQIGETPRENPNRFMVWFVYMCLRKSLLSKACASAL